jgi:hypothetical protein
MTGTAYFYACFVRLFLTQTGGVVVEFSNVLGVFGGLGLGSIFTLFIKEYFDSKKNIAKRMFEEKRDAYVSYLNIAARSQTMNPQEAIWARTAAIERIRLCGSPEVIRALNIVTSLPPDSPRDAVDDLVRAMRFDLFPGLN